MGILHYNYACSTIINLFAFGETERICGGYGRSFRKKESMHKTYELMVLLHPDLEIDVEAPIAKVDSLIEAVGGRVTKRDNWGKKRLAYRIRKQDFAIYVYFEMQLDPSKVSQLDSTILITEEVLRHILVVHEQNATRRDSKKAEKADGKIEKEVEEVTAEEGTK
jgi:small subunit ribosomal protein S6